MHKKLDAAPDLSSGYTGLAAELGFWPVTSDEADIERHRQHNNNAHRCRARTEGPILAANECEGCLLVDGTVGGTIEGGDIGAIVKQLAESDRMGYAGVWSTEVARDPFLPVLLAAEHTPRLAIGTAIAVAFARNPMSMATVANDLQSLSSGKFMLGLGSQLKAHIERRFSMPWSRPADRMREFVAAMHAIWDSWHNDQPLDFRGDFYQHTLMPPAFRPGRNIFGAPPVLIAAVGSQMTSVAAEVAEGMLVHGFTIERYLREVTARPLRRRHLAAAA